MNGYSAQPVGRVGAAGRLVGGLRRLAEGGYDVRAVRSREVGIQHGAGPPDPLRTRLDATAVEAVTTMATGPFDNEGEHGSIARALDDCDSQLRRPSTR
ncbi:hypothetical protein [Streptomyces sp. NPDC003487]